MKKHPPKEILFIFFSSLFAAVSLFFLSPVDLYLNNSVDLGFYLSEIIASFILFALIGTVALFFLWLLWGLCLQLIFKVPF